MQLTMENDGELLYFLNFWRYANVKTKSSYFAGYITTNDKMIEG